MSVPTFISKCFVAIVVKFKFLLDLALSLYDSPLSLSGDLFLSFCFGLCTDLLFDFLLWVIDLGKDF